jgi:prepilin-type N-terminal cleavage/methylation domain-containing protein
LLDVAVVCASARIPTVDEQRIRATRRFGQAAAFGAAGFTLVELLVTIVILGVVSAVVVFAVGGLRAQGQSSACATDRSALEAALEAHRAHTGTYAGEAELVAAGQLRTESSLHDVVLDGDGYTLAATGSCADADTDGEPEVEAAAAGGAAAVLEPTTTTLLPTTTSTTVPTTTTTKAPKKLKALKLAAVCTEASHWPDERAWTVKNANGVPVGFVLDAVNAHDHPAHAIVADAQPGTTTWFLPAADRGTDTATLDALGKHSTVKNKKSRC